MNMKGNNGKILSIGTGLHKSVSNTEISSKNYVLCSFKLEKSPVFRISPVLVDLEENVRFQDTSISRLFKVFLEKMPREKSVKSVM
jgi:hypothetical protein